jgi:hypothetical protein
LEVVISAIVSYIRPGATPVKAGTGFLSGIAEKQKDREFSHTAETWKCSDAQTV